MKYSDAEGQESNPKNTNILQNTVRILSGIDRSDRREIHSSQEFGNLSSVSQKNVVYNQSRIYFNMLDKRKESDEHCLMLFKPQENNINTYQLKNNLVRDKTGNWKKSGSSYPNNSTNTQVPNGNCSESNRTLNLQTAAKKVLPSGSSKNLRCEEKKSKEGVFIKKK
jgi:hypothetical protein